MTDKTDIEALKSQTSYLTVDHARDSNGVPVDLEANGQNTPKPTTLDEALIYISNMAVVES